MKKEYGKSQRRTDGKIDKDGGNDGEAMNRDGEKYRMKKIDSRHCKQREMRQKDIEWIVDRLMDTYCK